MNRFDMPREFAGIVKPWSAALWLLCALLVAGLPGGAMGQEVVTNTNDSGAGSLREALVNVPAGGTITFDAGLAGQTITLTSFRLIVTKSMTITGPAVGGIVIDGATNFQILDVSSGTPVDLALENLTLLNGQPSLAGTQGGAIRSLAGGNLRLRRCNLRGNDVGGSTAGGAIYWQDGSIEVLDCAFENNTAATGTVIWTRGGVTVANSLFANNSGNAAIRVNPILPGGSFQDVILTNSTFFGNTDGFNSVLSTAGLTSLQINNCTIVGNSGLQGPIAAYSDESQQESIVHIGNSIIAGNTGSGGVVNNQVLVGPSLTLTGGNNIWESDRLGTLTGDVTFADLGVANVEDVVATTLAYAGGTTSLLPLPAASPAINGGDNALIAADLLDMDGDFDVAEDVPYDQRGAGFARVLGGTVDVGAFESPCVPILVTNGNDSGAGSLRQALFDVCDGGIVVIDNDPSGSNVQTITLTSGQMLIDKTVTITTAVEDRVLVERDAGAGAFRHFFIDTDNTVRMEYLELANGLDENAEGFSIAGGGSIRAIGADLTLHRCLFRDNTAFLPNSASEIYLFGGAVYVTPDFSNTGSLIATECEFLQNRAQGDSRKAAIHGGAIAIAGVPMTIDSCLFEGNEATIDAQSYDSYPQTVVQARGGAILHGGLQPAQIVNSTFSNNRAVARRADSPSASNRVEAQGGAIAVNQSVLEIEHSTFVGNSADLSGDSISGLSFVEGASIGARETDWLPGLTHCSFSGGTVVRRSYAGVVQTSTSSELTFQLGTLPAAWTHNFIASNDLVDTILPAGSPSVQDNYVGTSGLPLDPQLGALADNGGETRTHLPNSTSVLVDNGFASIVAVPTTDQRGETRVVNGTIDIGAVELQLDELCQPTVMVSNANDSGPGSLRQAVADVCDGGTITFDPLVFTVASTPIGLLSEIVIDKDVTITGLGHERVSIRRANFGVFSHGLEVAAGRTVLVELLEVSNFFLDTSGAGDGGGSIINHGDLTLREVTLRDSIARDGSLVYTTAGSRLHAIDSRLINGGGDGTFAETGGAITAVEAELIVQGCYVGSNDANYGGAFYLSDSGIELVNSTLHLNRSNNGSAIYLAAVSGGLDLEASIRFSSVFFNPVLSTPTEMVVLEVGDPTSFATLSVGQSIFNTSSIPALGKYGQTANITATAAPGYNYLSGFDEPLFDFSSATNMNSGLVLSLPPAFNGGPTETMPLQVTSTLRDAIPAADFPVDGPATDQRGFPRPDGFSGRADIGAYEVECTGTQLVTNGNDSGAGSLREAVINACWGDTITFDPAVFVAGGGAPPINLQGHIIINKDLTIQGLGTDRVVIRKDDGAGTSGLFRIMPSTKVAMSDLTMRDGNQAFGALVQLYGELELADCHLLDSTTPGFGGAINLEVPQLYIDVPRTNRLTMSGCLVEGNSQTIASGNWAAIRAVAVPNVDMELSIEDTIFRNNDGTISGSGYGAIALLRFAPAPATDADIPEATVELRNVQIVDNLSSAIGAVYVSHPRASVVIEDSEISGNTANDSSAHVRVDSITGQDENELTIRNTRIANTIGRGVQASQTNVLIENCVIEDHAVTGNGAGLWFLYGNRDVGLEIVDSVIRNNEATSIGGGIYIPGSTGLVQSAPMRIVNSSIVNNTARAFQAGGMQVNDTNLEIIQSTIAGNRVLGEQPGLTFAGGAGIVFASNSVVEPCTLRLIQSTVAQNVTVAPFTATGVLPPGIFVFNQGRLEIGNSIVADNVRVGFVRGEVSISQAANLLSSGGNLIGVLDTGLIGQMLASDQHGTTAAPLDARLEPVGDYGGAFPTVRPVAGLSPALNAGLDANATAESLIEDQRGLSRFNGIVDVGAVESQIGEACEPTVVVLNNNDSGAGSLRQAVLDVCPGGTITFDPGFFIDSGVTPIRLLSEIVINKDVTITGLGRERVAIQRDNTTVYSHGLEVTELADVTLEGLEVRFFLADPSGNGGGAIINRGGLLLREVTLGPALAEEGSLVRSTLGSRLRAFDSRFIGGAGVAERGGAIAATEADVRLEGCYVANNGAQQGGAIHAVDTNVEIVNSTLSFNAGLDPNGAGVLYLRTLRENSNPVASVRFSTIVLNFASNAYVFALEAEPGVDSDAVLTMGQSILSSSGSVAVGKLGDTGQCVADASPGYNYIESGYLPQFDFSAPTNRTTGLNVVPGGPDFYGGPTENFLLAANSTLRDAILPADFPVDGPATDQRGLPRPDASSGRADIGATEIECTGTQVVTSPLDTGPGTLREAVSLACWGDTITFDPTVFPAVGAPTIDLFDQIIITKDLTIQGLGVDRVVVRKDPNPLNFTRLFWVRENVTVGFEDMTLRDGYFGSGALVLSFGSVTFDRCHLLNSRTNNSLGGAVYAFRPPPFGADLVVNTVRLSDCYVADHLFDLVGSGTWAPIVGWGSPNAELDMVIERTTFENNAFAGSGSSFGIGAVMALAWDGSGYTLDDVPPANIRLSDVTIQGNSSTGGGMVFARVPRFGEVLVEDSIIANNTIPGGAVQLSVDLQSGASVPVPGDFIVRDTTISNTSGIGVRSDGMDFLMQRSVVENHISTGTSIGAGVQIVQGGLDADAEIADSIIRNNQGDGPGAGVLMQGSSVIAQAQPWRITNSSIVGNGTRFYFSGGVYSRNVALDMVQSTVAENWVTAEEPPSWTYTGPPGILHWSDSGAGSQKLRLLQSTVSGNYINADPGITTNVALGIWVYQQGGLEIGNSIVAGNYRTGFNNAPEIRLAQTNPAFLTSLGGNIVGSMLPAEEGFLDASDQRGMIAAPLDPQLGPLQDNGGGFLTMMPLTGSPALNAGVDQTAIDLGLVNDQRGPGFDRFVGQVDIGAIEQELPDPVEIDGPLTSPFVAEGGTTDRCPLGIEVNFTREIDPATFTFDDVTLVNADPFAIRQTGATTYLVEIRPILIGNLTSIQIDGEVDDTLGGSYPITSNVFTLTQDPLPTTYAVADGDVYGDNGLIYALNMANCQDDETTIELAYRSTYVLDRVEDAAPESPDPTVDGANGLPAIFTPVVIEGDGSTIERDAAIATLRHLYVLADGSLDLRRTTLRNGVAAGASTTTDIQRGGSIMSRGQLSITESVFEGNSAIRGGAIYAQVVDFDVVRIDSSTFFDNEVGPGQGAGGAIYVAHVPTPGILNEAAVVMTNSTVVDNSSAVLGGGIFSLGSARLINTTVASNEAGTGGGVFLQGPVGDPVWRFSLELGNTIIATNTATSDEGVDVRFSFAHGFVDLGYNIIGVGGDHGGAFFLINGLNGNQLGTPGFPLNPLLASLTDNGGWVPTLRLLPGSPALDGGNPNLLLNPETDSRRVPRGLGDLADVPDVGAFEANKFPTAPIVDVHPAVDRQKEYWLQAAIFDSNNYDLAVGAPNPANAPDTIVLDQEETYTYDLRPRGYAADPSLGVAVLPVVQDNQLIIEGQLSVIERLAGAPDARILHLNSTDAVLREVTLQGGALFEVPDDLASNPAAALAAIFSNRNHGALIYSDLSDLTIERSTLRDGYAVRAAALYHTGTPSLLTIRESTVSHNITMGGFAVLVDGGTGLNSIRHVIENSTFSANSSDRFILEAISPTLYSLSLSAYSDSAGALGIYIPAGINANHITMANNDARGARIMAGGILAGETQTGSNPRLRIVHSIVAQNWALDAPPGSNPAQVTADIVIPDIAGTPAVFSDGYNLIGVYPSGAGAGLGFVQGPADLIGSDVAPYDPLILPLGNYGGPTQTHALDRDSDAVDHIPSGTLLVDQRGAPRPRRFGWDIGAYELGAFFVPCNDIATLIEAINLSNADPNPDEIFLDDDELCEGYDLDLTEGSFLYVGTNGLPSITTPITIFGEGQTIRRVNDPGIPQFRIFSVEPTGSLTLENITLENGLNLNAALITERTGGAILNRGALEIRGNSVIRNNRSQYGGAILNEENGTLNVERTTFTGNRAFTGGAIASWLGASATIVNSSISDNTADIFGGGVAAVFGGDMDVVQTTFARNRSESLGGGLYVSDEDTDITVTNSTFSGNSSRDDGGGLYLATRESSVMEITWTTFTDNTSRRGGGFRYFGPVQIGNSILAGNHATLFGPDAYGNIEVVSLGHNLIGDLSGNAGFSAANNDILGGVGIPLDPRLSPLTAGIAYGEIHTLLADSPALDAADPVNFPPVDQRGFPRPLDGLGLGDPKPDIGSVETAIFPVPFDSDDDGFSDEYELLVGTDPAQGFTIPSGAARRLNPVVLLDPNPAHTPRLGDLNSDLRLDRADLQILTRMAVGDIPPTALADINGDGRVNVRDVTQFSNFIWGEIDILR